MSDLDLERFDWPEPWARRRTATALIAGFLGAGAALAAIMVGTELAGGEPEPRAFAAVAFLPVLLAVLWVLVGTGLVRRRRSTAAVRLSTARESDVPGLALPYRRDVALVLLLSAAWMVLLGVVLVLVGAVVVARGGDLGAVVLGALLLGTLIPLLVAVARGRIGRGVVVLTPEGIVHRSWSFDLSAPWGAVLDVRPALGSPARIHVTVARTAGTSPIVHRSRLWPQIEARLAPSIVITAHELGVDPVLALAALRFYAAEPQRRGELGTPAAVDRLRRGDVPA